MDSERLAGMENEAEWCPVRRARTYQHLLQESCTIWSLPIMHYDRGVERTGRRRERETLVTGAIKSTICGAQTDFSDNIFQKWCFSLLRIRFASTRTAQHRPLRPHSSETSRPPPRQKFAVNGTSG